MDAVEMKAKIADLETEKALLLEENTAFKAEVENLKTQLESAATDLENVAAANESLKAEVAHLLETPDAQEKENGVGKTFELDGVKYKVLSAAISIPGFGKLSALDILANTDAQAWLVSKGSGSIAEVK